MDPRKAVISQYIGWPWVFYIYGILGIVIALVYLAFVRNTPAQMSWIDPIEREYIEANAGFSKMKIPVSRVPFRSIFLSIRFWAIVYTGLSGEFEVVFDVLFL